MQFTGFTSECIYNSKISLCLSNKDRARSSSSKIPLIKNQNHAITSVQLTGVTLGQDLFCTVFVILSHLFCKMQNVVYWYENKPGRELKIPQYISKAQ